MVKSTPLSAIESRSWPRAPWWWWGGWLRSSPWLTQKMTCAATDRQKTMMKMAHSQYSHKEHSPQKS